jgi:CNT family concentrative nucleoside transporter
MYRLISILGMAALLGIAFLLSNNRSKIKMRTVLVGLGLQFSLGVILLWWRPGANAFRWLSEQVYSFLKLSQVGINFLFGELGKPENYVTYGTQLAMIIAGTIIFFSAFMAILYYFGVMQFLVDKMARFMPWAMRVSGTESLSCSANVFVGMTEAPLLIRPFLDAMTISELHAIMVGGFATIAGSMLFTYMSLGIPAPHLIAASVMSAPAALVVAKIMFPETEHSQTAGDAKVPRIKLYENVLDAITKGTTDGMKLTVNVIAMLISFLALLALANVILGWFDGLIDGKILKGEFVEEMGYRGIFPATLTIFFGMIFSPLAFLMGVPWSEAGTVGNLLGMKIAANEFVSYLKLSQLIADGQLSERSITIATYALCGFANFGSIGIQIGGIGALAPGRRSDLAKLGLKAMIGGALASWMTATVAGLLI